MVPEYAYWPDLGPLPSEDALECLTSEDADLKLYDLKLELAEVDREYQEKRAECDARAAACEQREALCKEKQQKLEEIVSDIERHMRQNDAKWINAKQRYETENAILKQKEQELADLRRQMEKTREKKIAVQFNLSRDSKFLHYLNSVVKAEHESFDSIEAIVGRYEALITTMDETRRRLDVASAQLNVLRAELSAYTAEHVDVVLGQTSDMAAKGKTVEVLRENMLLQRERRDATVQVEKETRRKLVESLLAIQNVYHRVKTRAVVFDENSQLDEVLAYIGRRVKFFQETILHYSDLIPVLESNPELMKKLTSRTTHALDPNTITKIKLCARELALRPNSPRKPTKSRNNSPDKGLDRSKFAAWVAASAAKDKSGGAGSFPPSRTTSFTGSTNGDAASPQAVRRSITPTMSLAVAGGARSPMVKRDSHADDGDKDTPLRQATPLSRFAHSSSHAASSIVRASDGHIIGAPIRTASEQGDTMGPSISRQHTPTPSALSASTHLVHGPSRLSQGSDIRAGTPPSSAVTADRPPLRSNLGSSGSTRARELPAPHPAPSSASVRAAKPALKHVSDKELFAFTVSEEKPSSSAARHAEHRRRSIVFAEENVAGAAASSMRKERDPRLSAPIGSEDGQSSQAGQGSQPSSKRESVADSARLSSSPIPPDPGLPARARVRTGSHSSATTVPMLPEALQARSSSHEPAGGTSSPPSPIPGEGWRVTDDGGSVGDRHERSASPSPITVLSKLSEGMEVHGGEMIES